MREGVIRLGDQEVGYTFACGRGKRVSCSITEQGIVLVRAPRVLSPQSIEELLRDNERWIVEALNQYDLRPKIKIVEPYSIIKARAQVIVRQRIEHWNALIAEDVRGILIRSGKTRWGSCSRTRRLTFNYRLALLPIELVDYVVVHELCHLKEFNHSRRFWTLVGQYIPDWKDRRGKLRQLLIVG